MLEQDLRLRNQGLLNSEQTRLNDKAPIIDRWQGVLAHPGFTEDKSKLLEGMGLLEFARVMQPYWLLVVGGEKAITMGSFMMSDVGRAVEERFGYHGKEKYPPLYKSMLLSMYGGNVSGDRLPGFIKSSDGIQNVELMTIENEWFYRFMNSGLGDMSYYLSLAAVLNEVVPKRIAEILYGDDEVLFRKDKVAIIRDITIMARLTYLLEETDVGGVNKPNPVLVGIFTRQEFMKHEISHLVECGRVRNEELNPELLK